MQTSTPRVRDHSGAAVPALAAVDPQVLREAAEAFATEVLEECKWWRPSMWAPWVRTDRPLDDPAGAVAAHLTDEASFSVGPVRKSIVIDVDLPDYRSDKTVEAAQDDKLRAAEEVSLVLDSLGLPHLHVDSRGGIHTWVRCEVDPSLEVLEGLGRLLQQRLDGVELRPDGGRGIRLPFGVSNGVARQPFGESLTTDELLSWLGSPLRATDEQLRLVASAAPEPDRQERPRRDRRPAPHVLSIGSSETIQPPVEIPGWERWPVCKQLKLVHGLDRPSERHSTYFMVAAEAVLHAPELTQAELVAIQRAIPLNGFSRSSEAVLDSDARQNAKLVIERLNDANPIRTGCPRSIEAGRQSQLRQTFAHYCTDERAGACRLVHPQPAGLTPYAPVLTSSIWRGAQGGKTDGLGLAARAVFEFAVEQARGEPRIPMELTARYVEARRPYVTANAAGKALKRLSDPELGVLIKIDEGTYMLPEPLSADEVAEVEEERGTAEAHRKAIARHEQHWEGRRRSREAGMRAVLVAPGEGTPF